MTSEETITLTRKEYEALIERNSQLEDMLAALARATACVFPTRSLSILCVGRVPSGRFGTTRASP